MHLLIKTWQSHISDVEIKNKCYVRKKLHIKQKHGKIVTTYKST